MVVPAVDQSGQGERLAFTPTLNLTVALRLNLVPVDMSSLVRGSNDSHVCCYNDVPATDSLMGLDYIQPEPANISGPGFCI